MKTLHNHKIISFKTKTLISKTVNPNHTCFFKIQDKNENRGEIKNIFTTEKKNIKK